MINVLVTLRTRRLLLRPFEPEDAQSLCTVANTPAIARSMVNLPQPYPPELAADWIRYARYQMEEESAYPFAMADRQAGHLLGGAGLVYVDRSHGNGELGFWVSPAHWGRGYASEAVQAVLAFAFRDLQLHRVYALSLASNAASARVLQKAGFRSEGRSRDSVRRDGGFEDTLHWGLLETDPRPAYKAKT